MSARRQSKPDETAAKRLKGGNPRFDNSPNYQLRAEILADRASYQPQGRESATAKPRSASPGHGARWRTRDLIADCGAFSVIFSLFFGCFLIIGAISYALNDAKNDPLCASRFAKAWNC